MPIDFPSIVCTEDTIWGSPRIDGRRLAVGDVMSTLKYGGLHEALIDFELSRSEVSQALQYCSTLQCKTNALKVFCHNCSLRRQQEGPLDTSDLEEIKGENTVQVRGPGFIFFGSMEELLDDWKGQDWWTIAADLSIDLRAELFGLQDQN
ncbi:DUF433 domain-containing protein [Hymenobacter daeguensis]